MKKKYTNSELYTMIYEVEMLKIDRKDVEREANRYIAIYNRIGRRIDKYQEIIKFYRKQLKLTKKEKQGGI
jgi:hypothetical protein